MACTVAAVIFFSISATYALQWTSSVNLPDNSTVTACVGENVTMAWSYQTDAAEHVIDVEWLFQPQGQSEALVLASYGRGGFILAPSTLQNVQLLDNAGLHLMQVTIRDSGEYTVNAIVNLHGAVVLHSQRIKLIVSDAPAAEKRSLQVSLLPQAVQNNVTKEWNIQLACGAFSSLGQPPVSVVWTTPENVSLSSTYYDNGKYILVVDNPVVSGEYTCQLLHSPSSMCLSPDSPVLHAAVLNVDGVDARFSILEGQLHALQAENYQLRQEHNVSTSALEQRLLAENAQLSNQLNSLRVENANMREENANITAVHTAQLHTLTEENAQLRHELQNQRKESENLTRQVDWLTERLDDVVHAPADCKEVRRYDTRSGVHTLNVFGAAIGVYCDQGTDNGGWTVIQRRLDGSVDFYRGWNQYENGFGDAATEYWLGLQNIYRLTNSGNYSLRVDLEDWDGSTAYAVYDSFRIEGASDNYRLRISGYHGTAGDCMIANYNLNNHQFSTYDNSNNGISRNCASEFHGAWWYKNCMNSNLNGRYYTDPSVRNPNGVLWYCWKKDNRSYKRAEMKIRPNT